ncbi:MAG: hypothetical protein Q7V14_02700 [Coriobacteriia bacterium]|nr:hypothetical protein [Coriobacteriia bacterium]
MNAALFLVARVETSGLDSLGWLLKDEGPYAQIDPLDFLEGDETRDIHRLYRDTYSRFDAVLNAPTPDALLEFNRWLVIVDAEHEVIAFLCFKTTARGLKLGLAATDGSAVGREALKRALCSGLALPGAYAEVSGGAERIVAGSVPEVDPAMAERILGKPVVVCDDGRHYRREVTNVGPRQKLLVGQPLSLEPTIVQA